MKKILLFGLILSLIVLVGCGQQKTGTLVLQLTDAPPGLNISKVMVTLSQVEVHVAEETEDNNTSQGGWFTMAEGPLTFDLIAIQDVREFLGQAELSVGRYTQVRLSVDQASATIDGTEHDLIVPSEKIKLVKGFDIVANQTTTLTLDFDAQKSVVVAGAADKYLLKPTIQVIQE